jgi:hypothetical protein
VLGYDATRRKEGGKLRTEAEFLDVIGKKVLRVFLLAIHSHLYYLYFPPSPLEQNWFVI